MDDRRHAGAAEAGSLALAAVGCYLILFAPPLVFRIAAVLMSAGCYWEFRNLAAGHRIVRPGVLGLLLGLTLLFPLSFSPLIPVSVFLMVALAWALRQDHLESVLPAVAAELFGVLYTFLPWHFSELLRGRSVHWLFVALALNWVGDSAAYYVGRVFGKHRLAPVVSPKKSWEGAAGSVAASILFSTIYMHAFLPEVPLWLAALIGAAGNIAGQFGDLAESALKRGAGEKDSGRLLPGHGGLLDRVDSSLFSLPVVYICSLFL